MKMKLGSHWKVSNNKKFRRRLQVLLLHIAKEECWPRGALDTAEPLATYAPDRELSKFVRLLRKSARAWQVDMIRWYPGLKKLLAVVSNNDFHSSSVDAISAIEDMRGDLRMNRGWVTCDSSVDPLRPARVVSMDSAAWACFKLAHFPPTQDAVDYTRVCRGTVSFRANRS
jgi:hypothetical protein